MANRFLNNLGGGGGVSTSDLNAWLDTKTSDDVKQGSQNFYLTKSGTDIVLGSNTNVSGSLTATKLVSKGFVGIGKTNPTYPLDVSGTTNIDGVLNININDNTNQNPFLTIASNNVVPNIIYGLKIKTNPLEGQIGNVNNNRPCIVFDTLSGGFNGKSYIYLDASGAFNFENETKGKNSFFAFTPNLLTSLPLSEKKSVYITEDGLIRPAYRNPANISGFGNISGGEIFFNTQNKAISVRQNDVYNSFVLLDNNNNCNISGTLNAPKLIVKGQSGQVQATFGTSTDNFSFNGFDNDALYLTSNNNTSTITGIGTASNVPLTLMTNNMQRVRITNDGQVGIGKTTPSYPLDVSGIINANGLNTSTISGNSITLSTSTSFDSINILKRNLIFGSFLASSPSSNNFTSNNFTYNISASSIYDNTYPAYKAFDNADSGTGWACTQFLYNASGNTGLYTGSKSTNGYLGEWVQIERVSKPTSIYSYTIRKVGDAQYPVDFRLFGSNDGTTWTQIDNRVGATYPAGNFTSSTFTISGAVSLDITYSYYRLAVNRIKGSDPYNTLQFKGFTILGADERMCLGIGMNNPLGQLELGTDSAIKPSTTTWTTSSDERLKEDIQIANYDTCYDVLKGLDLKYYKWRDDIPDLIIKDRHKLGWIAQEVQPLFPKAVETLPEKYGLENVLTLNTDQIYAVMYGSIKKLMSKVEALEERLNIVDISNNYIIDISNNEVFDISNNEVFDISNNL